MKHQIKRKIRRIIFFTEIIVKNFFNIKRLFLFIAVFPYTMIGYKRLFNVYELAKTAIDNKIEGDFAECGVWKGGSTAVMGFLAQKEGKNRKTWLFDSFEGLPEPTEKDGFLAKSYSGDKNSGKLESINKCVGLLEDVEKIFFEILKLKKENIIIEKGWFQDVLPDAKKKMGKIAVLRLDGDWYESTKCCLENLYDNVTIGGYIIIDDYGDWEGAKKALDIFFIERNIKPELIKIDHTGVYFKK